MPCLLRSRPSAFAAGLPALAALLLALPVGAAPASPDAGAAATGRRAQGSAHAHSTHSPHRAHHGRTQIGKASVYSHRFAGKPMASGAPMDPHDDNAASKTLPLGTRARVTNLDNGRTATVTIEDRGPYVKGRIVDLSPATAQQLGISRQQGVAPVALTPISVPSDSHTGDTDRGSGPAPSAASDEAMR
jgi:rare lipoprotein A